MFNLPLIFVSALFFLGASAVFYMAIWLLVTLALRLLPHLPAHRKKRILFFALLVPPMTLGALAVGGATLHHVHAPVVVHHNDLCRAMYEWLVVQPGHPPVPGGALLNGAAWLLLAWGGWSILRLFWATVTLKRGLSPFLQPPSPKLAAAIARIQTRLGLKEVAFFEANIPMAYSCLLGFRRIQCILSRDLVAASTEAEIDAVVAHEMNHLRVRDVWSTLIVSMLNCLFFFLRPVRLLSRRWREETELACDEAAVVATGQPMALAAAILRAQGVPVQAKPLPTVALAFAEEAACAAEKRVERLLAYAERSVLPPDTPRTGLWQWVVTGLLTAFGMMALLSPQALCAVHCSLEAIARSLH